MSEDTEIHLPAVPEPAAVAAPRKFEVKNYIDEAQLKTDLAYSLTNLSDAMQNQASMTTHYSTLAAKAQRQVDDLELILEASESVIYRQLRDAAIAAEEKVTEPQLKQGVSANPRILSLKRALNEAKQISSIAKGAVQAFRQRKDMLVQEGSASRDERKGQLRIMEQDEAERTKAAIIARVRGQS